MEKYDGGYLFVHFAGEEKDGEQIYFSLSKDGLNWKDVNNGKPVLYTNIGECGARDPFPVRDERTGKTKKRHGGILKLDENEFDRLCKSWDIFF